MRLRFLDTPVAGAVVRVGEIGSRDIVGVSGDDAVSEKEDFEGRLSCVGEAAGRV